MNNAMNFNGAATDYVEHKVGFYDEDPIAALSKFFVSGDSAKLRVGCEGANPLVELFREGFGPDYGGHGFTGLNFTFHAMRIVAELYSIERSARMNPRIVSDPNVCGANPV